MRSKCVVRQPSNIPANRLGIDAQLGRGAIPAEPEEPRNLRKKSKSADTRDQEAVP